MKKSFLIILVMLYFINGNISAQSYPSSEEQSIEHSGSAHHDLNELAVFIGGTAKTEIKGTYFSLGLDYVAKHIVDGYDTIDWSHSATFSDNIERPSTCIFNYKACTAHTDPFCTYTTYIYS